MEQAERDEAGGSGVLRGRAQNAPEDGDPGRGPGAGWGMSADEQHSLPRVGAPAKQVKGATRRNEVGHTVRMPRLGSATERGRSRRRPRILPALTATVLLAAACSSQPGPGRASPTPFATAPGAGTPSTAPGPTGSSPTATGATGAPTPRATPSAPRPPASPKPSTAAAPPANPCAIGQQAPPPSSIGANFPTALAVAPDGRLFWAERSGTIRLWQDGAARTFATVSTVTSEAGGGYSERGLLGLAISPTFAQDRFVFAMFSSPDRAHQEIDRWTDCAGRGTDRKTLVRLPAGDDCCHKGGRLAFGPDGKLYATLGDEHVASAAQDTGDVRGKVLRYNPDGSVPGDNPFGGGNPVWAFGFRNPFGLAFSASGQMAVTVNGPTGDAGSPSTGYDSVVAGAGRGAGYQWPLCYGYSHPLAGGSGCGGQPEPTWSSERSTVAPTGAAYVSGAGPSAYADRLVFCTFSEGMKILSGTGAHATVTQGPQGCRLDVVQAPDHAIFYSDTGNIRREPGRG